VEEATIATISKNSADIENLRSYVDAVNRKAGTNWAVVVAGLAVLVSTVGGLYSLTINPLKEQINVIQNTASQHQEKFLEHAERAGHPVVENIIQQNQIHTNQQLSDIRERLTSIETILREK